MTKTVTYKVNGIGLMGFIFLVFLVLKLAGIGEVAHWSWWWVTCPLWLPTAIYWGFALIVGAIGLSIALIAVMFG
jgi:hypothetical protein